MEWIYTAMFVDGKLLLDLYHKDDVTRREGGYLYVGKIRR